MKFFKLIKVNQITIESFSMHFKFFVQKVVLIMRVFLLVSSDSSLGFATFANHFFPRSKVSDQSK